MDWVSLQQILTTVMTRIVDRSTDHAKPHSICFFYHNFRQRQRIFFRAQAERA